MAVWETTAPYTRWDTTNDGLFARTTVISKITDEKSAEDTLDANEAVKITFGGQDYDATFLGTVTVDGVAYPVISFPDDPSRYIIGLDLRTTSVKTLAQSDLDTSDFTVCFFPGTLIATPSGERKIEELAADDLVLVGDSGAIPATWFGRKLARAVSVKWIGRQTVSTLFGPADRLMPVRIAAGSLGGGGGANPSAT